MLMHLHFDAEKAVQVAAVILRNEGKRMTRLRLLKLMLISDREYLRKYGRPILGSKIVAMNNGPLHSDVYDLIKGNHRDEAIWSRCIRKSGPRDVVLTKEPSVGRLSKHEIELINEVSDQHEHMDDWELSEATHSFQEFKDHFRKDTSVTIPLEDMIDGVKRGADKESILADLKDDMAWDRYFEKISQ
jgi:uncharacterized phage-associated protein